MTGDDGNERLKVSADATPGGTINVDIVYIDQERADEALSVVATRMDIAVAGGGGINGCY